MANFKKGDTVKIVAVIPQGPVESMRMDEDGNVQYLISWTDGNGNNHSRWFDEAQLTAV
jgi:cell envelope opacity-associated protein A